MPESLSFDLKQLVRVCINDPELRAEVTAALAEGPLPVRTPCAHVNEGETVYAGILKSNREKAPGDAGFILRDSVGWITARLSEVVRAAADASTISAEQLAEKLGVRVEEVAEKLKPPGK